jgi:hypothetical protein
MRGRHTRAGACEKIEIASERLRGVIPARAGSNLSRWNNIFAWVPAFTGTAAGGDAPALSGPAKWHAWEQIDDGYIKQPLSRIKLM